MQILDQGFARFRINNAAVERLATGFRWAEGPAWFGDGRYLLWSDIPSNRIMRWDEETGAVSVFRRPSNNANGNTRDRQGRLITCEHDARRVTRTEYDGAISVILDRFDNKRLNSPNDVVIEPHRLIVFHAPAVRHPDQLRRPQGRAGAAHQRLSRRPCRPRQRGHRRRPAPEWAGVLTRRVPALRRRQRRQSAHHSCF